ncbi:hypothetical protein BZG00_10500 [Salinivibrio kushneri]|uniref:Polysaccharide biosynthesis protein C-terminal domain-containing protein n=2 Tax=Salinivibrio kushneri TaxID=1908198 RepID=A0AB36JWH3_9GAMM|nr:hypothetical protein BZG00_10500 [Salinivibrio kushneri]
MIKNMTAMLHKYKSVISWGLANKIASMGIGFFSVYLINQVFSKSVYGEMVFFQAIFFYILILVTLGFDKTIIYKVANFTQPRTVLLGGTLLDRFHSISIVALLLIECVFIIGWAIFSKSGFSNEWFWICLLSINALFSLSLTLYTSFFQANKCPEVALKISLTSTLVKALILFGLVIFRVESMMFFIVYLTLPTLISVGLLVTERIKFPTREISIPVVKSDYVYSCKLMLTKLVHQGVEKIDLLMIGFFLSTDQTAEYAVAAKLALLVRLGNELVSPLISPRLKYALSLNDKKGLIKEYCFNKYFSVSVASLIFSIYIIFGEKLLSTFGAYQESYPVLIVLSLSFINAIAFGPNGRLLMMAGHANISLYTTLGSLLLLVGSNYVLIPIYGAIGAAIGTSISLLFINIIIQYCVFIKTDERFNSIFYYLILVLVNISVFVVIVR